MGDQQSPMTDGGLSDDALLSDPDEAIKGQDVIDESSAPLDSFFETVAGIGELGASGCIIEENGISESEEPTCAESTDNNNDGTFLKA